MKPNRATRWLSTLWVISAFFLPYLAFAQSQLQTVRGQVTDNDTRKPLQGVTAYVEVDGERKGAISDEQGKFSIAGVPVGRRELVCTFPGYQAYVSESFVLTSAREVFLEVNLVLQIGEMTTDEVLITASNFGSQAANDLSVVSTRSFNAELTGRIPAAVNDPGRMALAFPGVQQGTDDSENDIIIRGNSSMGMLWRLEGLDIPTPNHFSRPGTSGGGLTVFSAQLIDRSDFSTGGMAAEYGNALSGAMDIHFRKGNMNAREYRARLGLLGLDFAAEGPIKKGRSSYLANYRASTLSLLNRMGFELVGERVDNDFTDFSFNLAFDGKNGRSFTTVFGIGGISLERYNPIPDPEDRGLGDEFRANEWEDRRQGSRMTAVGFTHKVNLDEKSYLKIAAAGTASFIFRNYEVLDTANVRSPYRDEEHVDQRGILSVMYQRKLGSRTRLKTGVFMHQLFYRFYRETVARADLFNLDLDNVDLTARGDGQTQTFQYFAQVSHALTDQLSINAGAHFYWLALNNTTALDPRISLKYDLSRRTTLSAAYGLHSQTLPMMLYFYVDENTGNLPNFDLPMMRSHHGVLSFSQVIGRSFRVLAEGYVQRLFQIPVLRNAQGEWNDTTDFWLLNNRESVFDPFVSEGKGLNYGLDVSLEKTFSKGVFLLVNGSVFEALYELPDGKQFNSRFASRWSSSYTAGKEFYFGNRTLQVGARVLYNGGMRYTPPDVAASVARETYVADRNRVNEGFVEPYFRIDSRIGWFWNSKKVSGQLTLDIQNLTNRKNTQNVGWSNDNQDIFFQTHPGGFIPVLSVQVDW